MIHLELKQGRWSLLPTQTLSVVLIAQKSKKKENSSGGKTKIDDYFESKYKKESELCIQNLS